MNSGTNLTPHNNRGPQKDPGKKSRRFWLGCTGAGVLLVAAVGYALWSRTAPALSQSDWQAHNIFALLADLNGTTDQMLQNTESLHAEVLQVRGKLGQLGTQEAILQKQGETGLQLSAQLTRQEQLTSQDVELMKQILTREKQSVALTTTVASQAEQLGQQVGENATVLHDLTAPLNQAGQESHTLNGQMDALLNELAKSEDAFQLFGKLNQLLDPSHLTDSLQKIEDAALPPAIKDSLKKLLPALPILPGSPSSPSNPAPSAPTTPTSPPSTPPLPLPVPTPPLPSLPLQL